jgi:hypothetical protein
VNRSVLGASWFAVRRAPLLVPAAAALLLVAATAPVQDDGHAILVLRGVGVLLACGWVATMDDPCGEVLGASPYPRPVRSLARAAAGLGVVLPVWLLAATVAQLRLPLTPVLALGVEALALCVAGVAIGAGLRAWTGHLSPSYLAVIGLVGLAIVTDALPRGWTMLQDQIWGPPWQAAQIRWGALLLVAAGMFWLALRDPLSDRRPARAEESHEPAVHPAAAARDHRAQPGVGLADVPVLGGRRSP